MRKKLITRGQPATIISGPGCVIKQFKDASFPKLSHSVFTVHIKLSTYLAQFDIYITYIKVNDSHKVSNFFIKSSWTFSETTHFA